MRNKKLLLVFLLLLLVVGCVVVFIWWNGGKGENPTLEPDSDAQEYQGNQDLPTRKEETKQIAIPGLESLVFIANQTEQKVNFFNPKENDCLFKLTLLVDGGEIWQSGFIEPNKGYYTITLSKALDVGEYDASLLYECFKADGQELNKANVNFPLYVQEE